MLKILIITGLNSFPIIKKVIQPLHKHDIDVYKAQISVSAFLSEEMVNQIIGEVKDANYDLILLPGFVQWDSTALEKKYSTKIRKGPEFASEIPTIINNLHEIRLSNKIPANKLFEISGEKEYQEILKEQYKFAEDNISHHTFFINDEKSDLIIGRNLPPPLIAEIVNCTERSNNSIIKKVNHYLDSGADIIDIGCVSNKPNPERVGEIIQLIRKNFNVLISIDSMEVTEIQSAVDEGIDMILSLDLGNYTNFLNLPKDIPIVILPTNMKNAFFPKEPELRVNNLFKLTKKLMESGFKKLIADPLLETPISPGISNSLEAYTLYRKKTLSANFQSYELPLFFGVSNVVELMDIDSVGINGLLASLAIELDIGIIFTVEHSSKLMGGVKELKDSIKLNYLAQHKNTPPINLGMTIFKAKKKKSEKLPNIEKSNAIYINKLDFDYVPDEKGYFRIYVNHYAKEIYVLFYSNNHKLNHLFIGKNAETLSKKVIKMNLTTDPFHLNYLGRELNKAENCLIIGKSYIQDE